ncbi:ferredoxin [Kiloniella antarctica]|uniref:Ferredoxin n=1 Tax=Kiloniella antarctica TaxID=1550907 RepID=A0ABW5BMA2_9PROT
MLKPSGLHYQEIESKVLKLGFLARGGFTPSSEDMVPNLSCGGQPQTVIVLGNAGSSDFWQSFIQSPEYLSNSLDPMDLWTRRVMDHLADELGGEALFPSDGPPYQPFQRWSSRAESLFPSPIGLYVSPVWGTWHALRAVILLPVVVGGLPVLSQQQNPCLNCADQPCLTSCPVEAFVEGQLYDYVACAKHVVSEQGNDCAASGCLARRGCPVGQNFILTPEHAAFHMTAFTNARRRSGEIF